MDKSTEDLFPIERPLKTFYLAVLLLASMSLIACGGGDSNSNGDAGTNGDNEEFTVSGELSNFDLGETRITSSNESDLAEGSIAADGSFDVTFADKDTVGEHLEAVASSGSSLDGFPGFICAEEVYNQVGDSMKFAAVPALTYLDGSSSTIVSLNSPSARPAIVFPKPVVEGYHVRWIYAEQAVSIQAECNDGKDSMDMELEAGWNEFILDTRLRGDVRQYTGERPDEVEWATD